MGNIIENGILLVMRYGDIIDREGNKRVWLFFYKLFNKIFRVNMKFYKIKYCI